jgi:TonB family protein
MVMAALPNRREPAFTGFHPPPSHPLRRLLMSEDPAPLAAEGFADPGPADRREEPELSLSPPALPQSSRREQIYLRPPALRQWRGSFGSLALHALVIALILIDWRMMPKPEPPPIPVQLVVEPPPQPKPKPPSPPAHHPRGPLASDDMGNTAKAGPQELKAPNSPAPPAAPPAPPAPPAPALITPPPSAAPSVPLDLPKVADLAAPLPVPKPKPAPPPRPPAKAESRPAPMSLHQAKIPGPAASRDEYLAYAFSLIRRHFYLLPRSVIGERRGEAVIGFVVHDNGSVSQLEVEISSGYVDIDRKAEEMIIAVGRFPPLPQWFQGEGIRLEFHLEFPTAVE